MARVLLANRSEVTQNHSNPNLLSMLNGKLLINSFNVCYNECKDIGVELLLVLSVLLFNRRQSAVQTGVTFL